MKAYERTNNYNEMNAIYALNSKELKDFYMADFKQAKTLKHFFGKKRREDNRLARRHQEYLAECEKYAQEYEETEKHLNEMETKLTNMAKSENLTIEMVAKVVDLFGYYSDIFKDQNGFRPRGFLGWLWDIMKTSHPQIIAQVDQMSDDGTWWDFVDKVVSGE